MPDNPYRHFNDPKSTCYMRLWELEGGDGADVGYGFAGGNAAPPWEAEDADESDSDDESDLSNEDFEEFGGDDVVAWDDDSDNEDPAPDQRRANRPHIEFVNFAANGVNQRIELPGDLRRAALPPPAPNPPANRRGIARRRGNARAPALPRDAAQAQPPRNAPQVRGLAELAAEMDAVVNAGLGFGGEPDRVAAAPGQGNNADAGLQRFLRLALEDREDEWDSDEDEGPPEPPVGPRARNRRR